MSQPTQAKLLRVFIGEKDKYNHRPLYESIVELARDRHLAGATVLRGLMGFGAHSRMHTAKVLRLSEDLPLVVEIVDTVEKLDAFLPELQPMIEEGIITLENVQLIACRKEND
jgi:PII-like signaling protein